MDHKFLEERLNDIADRMLNNTIRVGRSADCSFLGIKYGEMFIGAHVVGLVDKLVLKIEKFFFEFEVEITG